MSKNISWLAILATLLAVHSASAHFVWVAIEKDNSGQSTVAVWFSELAEPDDAKLIDKIVQTKAWLQANGKQTTALELKKVVAEGGGSLSTVIPDKSPNAVTAVCNYGVIERNGKFFLLNYYAKYLEADANSLKTEARSESLPLDVVPQATADGYEVEVLWQGKPAAACEVTVNTPDAKQEKYTADKAGKVQLKGKQAGVYSIRAKFAEDTAGSEGGKEYKQIVHYCTLAMRAAEAKSEAKPAAKE